MSPDSKIPPNIHNRQLLVSMARRRGIKLITTSQEQQSISGTSQNLSERIQGRAGQEIQGRHSEAIIHPDQDIPGPDDVMKPSTDLRWVPGIVWKWRYFRGSIRRFWRALHPKLSPDEFERREHEDLKRELNQACLREAHQYLKVITPLLQRVGNEVTKSYSKQLVKWRMVSRDEDFTKIILVLDVEHVPAYLFLSRLSKDPRWIDPIIVAIGLEVHWEVAAIGAHLVIHRSFDKPVPKRRVTVAELVAEGDDSI